MMKYSEISSPQIEKILQKQKKNNEKQTNKDCIIFDTKAWLGCKRIAKSIHENEYSSNDILQFISNDIHSYIHSYSTLLGKYGKMKSKSPEGVPVALTGRDAGFNRNAVSKFTKKP